MKFIRRLKREQSIVTPKAAINVTTIKTAVKRMRQKKPTARLQRMNNFTIIPTALYCKLYLKVYETNLLHLFHWKRSLKVAPINAIILVIMVPVIDAPLVKMTNGSVHRGTSIGLNQSVSLSCLSCGHLALLLY